jgi:uncharacterized OB-fold protein
MEEFILDFVNFVANLDFSMVFRIFLILYVVFWFFIVIWVWFDACDKSDKWIFRIFSTLLVFTFNIFGLIVYFLIRPAQSYEERYWQELEKKYLEFETGGLTNCSSCGFALEPSFANCPNCGKEIKVKCENCGSHIEPNWKYCPYCGSGGEKEEDTEEEISQEIEIEEDYEEDMINIGKARKKEEVSKKVEEIKIRIRKFINILKLRLSNIFALVGKKSSEFLDKTKSFLREGESENIAELGDTGGESINESVVENLEERKQKKTGKKKKKKGNKRSKRK